MRQKIRVATVTAVVSLALAGVILAGEVSAKYKDLDQLKGKDVPIVLAYKGEDLRKIFGAIEKVANVNISFGEGFPTGKTVTFKSDELSLKQALIQLAEKNALTYEVTDPDSLVVKVADAKP